MNEYLSDKYVDRCSCCLCCGCTRIARFVHFLLLFIRFHSSSFFLLLCSLQLSLPICLIGTLQLEFRALLYFTDIQKYEETSMKALQSMATKHPHPRHGFYPVKVC